MNSDLEFFAVSDATQLADYEDVVETLAQR